MGRLTPRERTGLLIGVLAMFLALDVAFLVSLVGLPFTPYALGQAIIDVLPGWISIPLIELLHFWAKALLVIGVLALFVIAGGVAGALAISPPRGDARRFGGAVERYEPVGGAVTVAFGRHGAHGKSHAPAVRRELRVGEETEGVEILRGHRRKEVWHRVVSCHIWDVSRRGSALGS